MSPTTPPSITSDNARDLVRDEALWERGERLFAQEAVGAPTRRGRLLLGTIEGSAPEPYAISIEPPLPGKQQWRWHCTCPYFEIYGGPCKHNAALLLQWSTRPESFEVEASLDEQLAGEGRTHQLALIRETLRNTTTLQRLLRIEPEPKKPLGRLLNLAPYEEQLRYALQRYTENEEKQEQLFVSILETAAGYLRVEDAANAARLATLLTDTLLSMPKRPRVLRRLLFETLDLLEASTLDADWGPDEQATWLQRVTHWWEEADVLEISDRLLDLVFHCYRPTDIALVERWLRSLLRKPVQGNRLSSGFWRQRVLDFLLAFYDAAGRIDAFLDLCWEEGEDALAAQKLVRSGNVKDALQLAQQGLRSSNAHREVAAALLESGERDAAWRVAEAGLRYEDRGRGALLAWLAARALEQGESERALSLAQRAWEEGATLERYELLRRAAERAELWPNMRRALHAALE
ncbi:MAG: SWIM zinc finger domain-containing protein, partial [Chloroflexota bacterium]|nr:SWIM zinc finger domain-containing protein [Chloroflexota bacterium]